MWRVWSTRVSNTQGGTLMGGKTRTTVHCKSSAAALEHMQHLHRMFEIWMGQASLSPKGKFEYMYVCTMPTLSFDTHDNDLQIFPASKPKAAAKSRKKLPSDYNGQHSCSCRLHTVYHQERHKKVCIISGCTGCCTQAACMHCCVLHTSPVCQVAYTC